MKKFTVEIKVPDDDTSFRDIERTLNQLNAETTLYDVKVEEGIYEND